MHTRAFRGGVIILVALTGTFLSLALVIGCGGGEKQETKDLDVQEVWSKVGEADENIESEHTEITIYYENTQFGSGQTMSMIVDRNGDDTHEKQLLFGQVVSEYIQVGDKEYYKEMEDGAWTESPAVSSEDTVNGYASNFPELPALADTQEYLGEESLGDRLTEHFRFSLSTESVNDMFPPMPPSDFSQNTGGEVDAWVDAEDYFLVRYELVIHNVLITDEIGNGDIRFVVYISGINEPIEIAPPI